MKLGKRFTALILALVMVFSLTATASATEKVTVKLSPNITVTLNGEAQAMADVKGNPVYPVLYGGTTYLPVRAVGNMLGLAVDWEQSTKTVRLDKDRTVSRSNGNVPTNATPKDIAVQIDPSITVKYNGKTQEMTDTNGNPVYPMLYGGTTYLPVRAVSNMLGVGVKWDQNTQTVILTAKLDDNSPKKLYGIGDITVKDADGNDVLIEMKDPDTARKQLEAIGWDKMTIDEAIASAQELRKEALAEGQELDVYEEPKSKMWTIEKRGIKVRIDEYALGEARKIMLDAGFTQEEADDVIYSRSDPFGGAQTSNDAKVLGENHIGYDWAEIDWSTVNKGYISVKVNEQLTQYTHCQVSWYSAANGESGDHWTLAENQAGKWINIPLWQDSGKHECLISIFQEYGPEDYDLSEEENSANYRDWLQVRFAAEIDDPNTVWLLSHIKADYKNAPNAVAKAKELTQNCKTDAEKITAIYNFVSQALTYDRALYNSEKAREAAGESKLTIYRERDLNPDSILASKKGVCEHYAVLMTAMLRSVGVPCKLVSGAAYFNTQEGEGHAWVAVKPETGTLNISGAGKDFKPPVIGEKVNSNPTGWIRLDPTNASHPNTTSNDSLYVADQYY